MLEEYVPGLHRAEDRRAFGGADVPEAVVASSAASRHADLGHAAAPATNQPQLAVKQPLRGALVVGGDNDAEVAGQLRRIGERAAGGEAPAPGPPDPALTAAAGAGRDRLRQPGRARRQGGPGREGAGQRLPARR